jgi:hypothetical protein
MPDFHALPDAADGFPFGGPEGASRASRPVPRRRVDRRLPNELHADDDAREPVKGMRGRPGYPLKALNYARKLRAANRRMTASEIRDLCLKIFTEDELPPDGEGFRRWLNRRRKKRPN